MKIDNNSKLSEEIEIMRDSIVDINSQYSQQQLEVYGYNPNKHWTILNQYEAAAGEVPKGIAIFGDSYLKEERRLAKELEPYNNFVFSYRESSSLPTENIGKEPVTQVQSKGFLTDSYNLIKELPRAITKNPKTSAKVAGAIVAVPLLLNAGPLTDCVSHGGYEMQKYFDNIKLPELAGVASAASDSGADIPGDWYDETQKFHGGYGVRIMTVCDGFNEIDSNKIIPPDEITQMLRDKSRLDDKYHKYDVFGEISIGKSSLAGWLAVASENEVHSEQPMIRSHLIPISTDTDPDPEELAAICFFPYDNFADLSPIENHLVGTGDVYDEDGNKMSGYLVNPFDIPENLESYTNTQKLLYWKNPEVVNIAGEPIYWKDAIGKTPKELGLDEYNKPTAADRKAYEARQDEKLYEQLVEQGVGEESAEKMVEDMRTDTATEEDKTNPLVYIIPAGLGTAGIAYFATRKKSGQLPTPATPA